MIVNQPRNHPIHIYAVCVNDGPSRLKKPVLDNLKAGEVYTVYHVSTMLNASTGDDGLCFYVKDQSGRKIEPHEDAPAWSADRFKVLFEQWLN